LAVAVGRRLRIDGYGFRVDGRWLMGGWLAVAVGRRLRAAGLKKFIILNS